jgi:hypothetical protein
VTGTTEAPEVTATATGADLVLMGRPLADGKASFSGIVAGPRTGGAAELSGMLGDVAIKARHSCKPARTARGRSTTS